jgi:hypothetical protein
MNFTKEMLKNIYYITRKNIEIGSLINQESEKYKESSLFFLIRKIPLVNISQLLLHPNLKKRKLDSQTITNGKLKLFAKINHLLIEYLDLVFPDQQDSIFMPYNLSWFVQSEELKLLKRGLLGQEKKSYPRKNTIINFDDVKGFETLIDRKVRLYEGEFDDGRWVFGKEKLLQDSDDDIFLFYHKHKIKSIFSLAKCQNLTEWVVFIFFIPFANLFTSKLYYALLNLSENSN